MTSGFVLFTLAERTFATSLDDVREIVRMGGLQRLPGVKPPLAGVIILRGTPLPVLDIRAAGSSDDAGDVLVMTSADDEVGVAVDGVLAVLHPDELPEAGEAASVLPSYVTGVRRYREDPVLLVDLQRMLDISVEGWTEALTSDASVALAT